MRAKLVDIIKREVLCEGQPTTTLRQTETSQAPPSEPEQQTLAEKSHEAKTMEGIGQGKTMVQLKTVPLDVVFDLVCIGFGPSNLSLAVALHDQLEAGTLPNKNPKVLFIERQQSFRWHEGMQLPGTKMQITFIKDLATLRNPRSHFTFLNYLQNHGRLPYFSNLGTFEPSRLEYQDYMKWCAAWFDDVVLYGKTVTDVEALPATDNVEKVSGFKVCCTDNQDGMTYRIQTKQVVIGMGGRPHMPAKLAKIFPPNGHPQVIHSSSYALAIPKILPVAEAQHRIAVIGSGQSAAEIFSDLGSRFPKSTVDLIMRGRALQEADDSPFVNEIFNPDVVDEFFLSADYDRSTVLAEARATNYGVVQADLLRTIYANLYNERAKNPDESKWRIRILTTREVTSFQEPSYTGQGMGLWLSNQSQSGRLTQWEKRYYDLVILATGYERDGHEEMLKNVKHLMQEGGRHGERWQVGRDYGVKLNEKVVPEGVRVWLQGSNEKTHGISDTLLSLLAVRAGELVQSIFSTRVGYGSDLDGAGLESEA